MKIRIRDAERFNPSEPQHSAMRVCCPCVCGDLPIGNGAHLGDIGERENAVVVFAALGTAWHRLHAEDMV